MTIEQLDEMAQYVIAALFESDNGWRSVTRDLVRGWDDVEGLQICFALVAAGNAIEETFNRASPACDRSTQAYRLAALVSADLFGMSAVGGFGTKARDLQEYWHKHDQYFLNL